MLDSDLLKRRMQDLNLNVAQLAAISGTAPNKLSQFLGGTRPISAVEITRLRNALDDVAQLIQAAQPFPLSFRNTTIVRELISDLKRGELRNTLSEVPKADV